MMNDFRFHMFSHHFMNKRNVLQNLGIHDLNPSNIFPFPTIAHQPLIETHPPRTAVLIKRRTEKTVLSRKQREGMKAREVYLKYPKQKADALMKSLREKGLFHYDPDFEGDEEDRLLQGNQHNMKWYCYLPSYPTHSSHGFVTSSLISKPESSLIIKSSIIVPTFSTASAGGVFLRGPRELDEK